MKISALRVAALTVFWACAGVHTTHAQLRSLAALKHLALESSPGAERETKALRGHYVFTQMPGLLVGGITDVPAEGHARFARCVVSKNLPKPRTMGLACYDASGAYVGTKRAAKVDALAHDVWSTVYSGSVSALPLHFYRYIQIAPSTEYYAPNNDYRPDDGHLAALLKKSSGFTYINNVEDVAESDRQFILTCKINSNHSYTHTRFYSTLILANMDGAKVGIVRGEGNVVPFITSSRKMFLRSVESAVQNLNRARKDDEETYAPR